MADNLPVDFLKRVKAGDISESQLVQSLPTTNEIGEAVDEFGNVIKGGLYKVKSGDMSASLPAVENFNDAQSLNYGGDVLSPTDPYKVANIDGTEVAVNPVDNAITALPIQQQALMPAAGSTDLASTSPDAIYEQPLGPSPAQQQAGDAVASNLMAAGAGKDVSAGAIKNITNNLDAMSAAEIVAANEKQALNNQTLEQMAKSEERAQQLTDDYKTKYNEQLETYKQKQKEYADTAKAKIDPAGYWKDGAGNPDTGKRIMSGIAIALSGIGATLQGPGAKNQALDIIMGAIDRDIDAQKANLANKRQVLGDDVSNSKTLLGELSLQFKDADARENAARALMLQKAIIAGDNITAKLGGTKAAAQWQIAKGELQFKVAEHEQAANERAKLSALVDTVLDAEQTGNPVDQRIVAKLPKETQALITQTRQVNVPGFGRTASAQEGQTAREMVGATNSLNQLIKEMGDLKAAYPIERQRPGDVNTKLKSLAAQATVQYGKANKLGTLDAGTERITQGVFGNPTSLLNFTNYDNLQRQFNQSLKAKIKPLLIYQQPDAPPPSVQFPNFKKNK